MPKTLSFFRACLIATALFSASTSQSAEQKFASPVVTQDTPGHSVPIELDVRGARMLFLEVTDGGNGSAYDWADWMEPTLIGPDGKKTKLTDLKWREVKGRANVGKNQGVDPLRVNGEDVSFGIGTHASSTIIYELPEDAGFTKFQARGGLDNGGTNQPGSTTSVQFRVYTSEDAHFVTPVNLTVLEGFAVKRVLSDSLANIGSWVALGVDAKGRLITADRQGPLYRITLPQGEKDEATVERLPVEVGGANGFLQAFGSFYVVGKGSGQWNGKSGLFRLTDTTEDDQYDKVEFLIPLTVGGDHHAHAVILSPDKSRLMILCGNSTDPPKEMATRHIRHQSEDHLLPRSTYYGHNTGRQAPGGFVITCDPNGGDRHFFCAGFRNPYDIALNNHGELFTFDADMEYDVGGPWYRPTRVNHCVSGGEYGWRWGAGKWPNWYPDTSGTTVDIGRGSPTGIVFGYGAKFPAKYQNALFLCDWTYGRIVAVHLKEKGASYTGTFEEFLAGPGNPVSDIVIHPNGAMYFVTGGRRNPTSLYEVTYVGKEPTQAVKEPKGSPQGELRGLRRQLESLHAKTAPGSVDFAWPHLSHADRHIRFAARTVLEHHPVDSWAAKAIAENHPVAAIESAVALARSGEAPWKSKILLNLNRIDVKSLQLEQKLDLLRAYGLVFIRMGRPDDATTKHLIAAFSQQFPSGTQSLDHELCQMLLYLDAPGAVSKTVAQLTTAETQSEQMFYSYHLRTVATGWTTADLTAYAEWIAIAQKNQGDYIGGGHFANFLNMLDVEANKRMSDEQKELVATIRDSAKPPEPTTDLEPREFVRKWTVADLAPHASAAETGRSFIRGRKLYEGMCAKCHLLKGKGGALGPDLTSAGRKYKHVAMLTEIIDPSKSISDQHASVILEMESGKVLTGREVGGDKDTIRLVTNPEKPNDAIIVKRSEIEVRRISKVSLMPLGMIDTLTTEEILDLLMYVSSGGDRGHRAFQQ
jgi:putative heme-binding domain-containing protein